MEAYIQAGINAYIKAGIGQGAKLNLLISWAFWSKENDNDYYASIEDNSPFYSITEKE